MSKIASASCSTNAEPRNWLGALAIASAALVYDPSAPARVPKTFALTLVALSSLALAFPSILQRRRRVLNTPLLLLLTLVGWIATSMVAASHPLPLDVAPLFASTGLALALVGLPAKQRRQLGARVAVLTGLGSALLAVAFRWQGGLVHGGHGNRDWLGLVLVAALPWVVEHAQSCASPERWLARAAALAMVVVLALSGSRSAWFGGGAAALWVLRGRARWFAAAAVAAGTALVLRLTDFEAALAGRLWIWRHAWEAGITRPVWGHGAGRFAFAFLEAQGADLRQLPLDRASVAFVNAQSAHNDALHLFVEAGAPAALGILGILGLLAWRLRRRAPAAAATAIVVMVAGIADVPLLQPGVLVMLAFAVAVYPRAAAHKSDALPAGVVLLMMAALLPATGKQWLSERALTQARRLPVGERLALLRWAADTSSHGPIDFELGIALASIDAPDAALEALARSHETFANVGTYVAEGNVHLAMGDGEKAMASLGKALRLQPARFAAHANFVEAARQAGHLPIAEEHLRAAEDLQPHDPKLRDMRERLRRAQIDATTNGDAALDP